MTREEASYILRKFYADGYKSNNYNALEQALKLAVMCLENLPHWISVEFPRWISVEDELPKDFKIVEDSYYAGKFEESDIVMVAFDDGDFGFARYVHDFPNAEEGEAWYWFAEGNLSGVSLDDGEVTHWMPLPQAPTVAKNATVKKGGEHDTEE